MRDFLHMGGYAFFVWTSYAIVALVLILNVLLPLRERRQVLAELRRKARRTAREGHRA